MAKRKPKTVPKMVEEAAVILQRIVRIKAADHAGYASCVTCGATKHWTELQGGHFFSRRHTAHKLREENVHCQCQYCNCFLKGNLIPYTVFMIDMYGRGFVDELEHTKNDIKKYSRGEILGIIEDLKHYEFSVRTEKGL